MGHLLFDTMLVVVVSTIIIVVFAAAAPKAFAGLGFFVSSLFFIGFPVLTCETVAYPCPLWDRRCLTLLRRDSLCVLSSGCFRISCQLPVHHLHRESFGFFFGSTILTCYCSAIPGLVPHCIHICEAVRCTASLQNRPFRRFGRRSHCKCGMCSFSQTFWYFIVILGSRWAYRRQSLFFALRRSREHQRRYSDRDRPLRRPAGLSCYLLLLARRCDHLVGVGHDPSSQSSSHEQRLLQSIRLEGGRGYCRRSCFEF